MRLGGAVKRLISIALAMAVSIGEIGAKSKQNPARITGFLVASLPLSTQLACSKSEPTGEDRRWRFCGGCRLSLNRGR